MDSDWFKAVNGVIYGNSEKFEEMLKDGHYVNSIYWGETALMVLAIHYHKDHVKSHFKMLLSVADVNIINKDGKNVLMELFKINTKLTEHHVECVKLLLDAKINLNHKDNNNRNALMYLIEYCSGDTAYIVDCFKLLFPYFNITDQDKFEESLLMMLMSRYKGKYHIDCLKILLEQGQNLNLQDNNGDTALMYGVKVCNEYDIECLKLLLEKHPDVNIKNKYGQTALIIATSLRYGGEFIEKNIKLLIDAHANVHLKDNDGNTALMTLFDNCTQFSDMNIIGCVTSTLLLNNNINFINISNIKDVNSLIFNGYNVNLQDNKGRTPLMKLLQKYDHEGYISIVEILLLFGANVNLQDVDGNTALFYACDNSDSHTKRDFGENILPIKEKIISLLIKAKANVNIQNKKSQTILHHVIEECKSSYCKNNISNIINMLIDANINIHLRNSEDKTVLKILISNRIHTWESCKYFMEYIKLLLKPHPNLNLNTEQDIYTELITSCEYSKFINMINLEECLELLLRAGMHVPDNLKDHDKIRMINYKIRLDDCETKIKNLQVEMNEMEIDENGKNKKRKF
jgi:uncharacterized protein